MAFAANALGVLGLTLGVLSPVPAGSLAVRDAGRGRRDYARRGRRDLGGSH